MSITKVKYLTEYVVEITLSNGKVKQVNFANFLFSADDQSVTQYRDRGLFSKVRMGTFGQLIWGHGDDAMVLASEFVTSGQIEKGLKYFVIDGKELWAWSKKSAVEMARIAREGS